MEMRGLGIREYIELILLCFFILGLITAYGIIAVSLFIEDFMKDWRDKSISNGYLF